MDRKVRIAVAAGVLLSGALGAMFFRRGDTPQSSPTLSTGEHHSLRRETTDGQRRAGESPASAPAATSHQAAKPVAPTYLAPQGPAQPPFMAREFPGFGAVDGSQPPPPLPAQAGETATSAAQTHRIVDGDSLEKLAQRYLGAADRAGELYEANRETLSNPGVLPIGKELRIPGPRRPPGLTGNLMPRAPLVPVKP
jgi:nucleoid-associated protein YgaU